MKSTSDLLSTLMRAVRAALIGGAAVMALPQAQAGVISFEGVGSGLISDGLSLEQAALIATTHADPSNPNAAGVVAAVVDGSDPLNCLDFDCPINNHSYYYAAYYNTTLALTAVQPNQTFQVQSFDASFIGSPPGGPANPAFGRVRVQGTRADHTIVYEDFDLDGRGATGYTFQHFNLSNGFGQQQFVDVAFFGVSCNGLGACAPGADNNQFALDNIAVAVPEPSTYLMMLLGLCAVAVSANTARRNKSINHE